ncbi:TcpE family conjugal transfer membrane protein [Nonomuraea sp. SYSU D8015]|uniref:TcpE family conjugal transfer membrane protein n=1 Tax=Nonomuraea sp. SYSU D8015 TaxID=2593644 RepID=UPI00166020D0|nr:TcpE family conjugal transfer membrane protein [Nonomuraea sp. SYSU D8015]
MDLPTYTNIWRIEKRLYKLYDLRLPMPLPIVWIGVFVGVFVPWSLLLILVGVPVAMPWHVLFLVPPGIVTWLSTRPVIEGKRLTELLESHLRYLGEPKAWYRLAPLAEPETITFSARVWRTAPARAKSRRPGKARHPQRRREDQRIAGPRQVRPAVAAAAAAAGQAPVAEPATGGTGWGARRGTAAPALKAQVRQGAPAPATGGPAGAVRRQEGLSGGSGRRQDLPLVVVHGDDAPGPASTSAPVERQPTALRADGRTDRGRTDGARTDRDRADGGRTDRGRADDGRKDDGRRGGGKRGGGWRLPGRERALSDGEAQRSATQQSATQQSATQQSATGQSATRQAAGSGEPTHGDRGSDGEGIAARRAQGLGVEGRRVEGRGAEGREIAAEELALREMGAAPVRATRSGAEDTSSRDDAGSAGRGGDAERRAGHGAPGEAETARGTVVPIKTAQSRRPAAGKPIDTEALRRLRRLAASADAPADPAGRVDVAGRLESERHEEEVARDQHRKGQPPRLGPASAPAGTRRVWPPLNPDAKPSPRPDIPRPGSQTTDLPAAGSAAPAPGDTDTPAPPPVAEGLDKLEPVRDVPGEQPAARDGRTESGPVGEIPGGTTTPIDEPNEPAATVDLPEDGASRPDATAVAQSAATGDASVEPGGTGGNTSEASMDADGRPGPEPSPVDRPAASAHGRPGASALDQAVASVHDQAAASVRDETGISAQSQVAGSVREAGSVHEFGADHEQAVSGQDEPGAQASGEAAVSGQGETDADAPGEAAASARDGALPTRDGTLPVREGALPARDGALPAREGETFAREEASERAGSFTQDATSERRETAGERREAAGRGVVEERREAARREAVEERRGVAGREAGERSGVRTGELVAPVPVPRPGEGRVRRVESVVGRDSGGWRRIAQVVVGGSGVRTDGSEIDEARARAVFSGSRRIVVLGCTGGAGQSTTALMLGHTFAQYRDDRIVAVDANTGGSTLTSRIQPETPETLTSLLSGLDRVSGYLTMRGYTTRTATGLEVISADTDAGAEQRLADRSFFSDHRLGESMRLLDRHYKLAVIDPAAALAARLLPYADQLVLVVPASEEASEAVAMTYEWLDGHGCAELRRRAVMVVNGVSRRSMADVEQAEAVARGRCRAIVRVPWEDDLAPGGAEVVDPGQLRAAGRRAYLALAGVVVAGFAAQTVRPSEEELASDPPGTRIGER